MNSLTYAEQALLDLLPSRHDSKGSAPNGKMPDEFDARTTPGQCQLIAGNRTGVLPAALLSHDPSTPLIVHAFDFHHARAISDFLAESGFDPAQIVQCTSSVTSPSAPYSSAFFQTTPRSMPTELVLDQLEDIHRSLADNSFLYAAFEGDADDALRTVKKVFPSVNVLRRDKKVVVFRCRRTAPLAKYRSFSSQWSASVPGGQPLQFTSLPGCFCHRRADPGGLALAEVASKFVETDPSIASAPSPLRILDMGCGCGLVGLLVADALRRRTSTPPHLTLIDSHARAIAASRINAAQFNLADSTRFILSDSGLPRGEVATHDIFVGNPPYYSEYRIAEIFLSTAYRALRPGGTCLTVVKTATGLKALQEKYFRTAEVIPRRGYAVLRSTKAS